MHKIWLVLRSEYLRRVRTKGFILATLLLPLALTAFLVVVVLLTVSAMEEDKVRTIAVVDETGVLLPRLADEAGDLRFEAANVPADSLRALVIAEERYAGYLLLPAGLLRGDAQAVYYSVEGGGFSFESRLDGRLTQAVEAQRLHEQNVPAEVLALLQRDVSVRMVRLTETGEEAGGTGFFAGLGFGMGFLIFMMMVIYGAVVMQGVIDEKSSRVVEVVVSSVKPFHLMMGKVLGIGAMGLTQMIVWSALTLAVTFAAGPVVALFIDPASLDLPESASTAQVLEAADVTIPSLDPMVLVWFVFFFLGGYLLYAAFYATIGSLVESQQEAQSFLFPLLLPLIISMYTLMPQIESPNGTLSVVLSMLPLTSPISMIVRVAVTDVPAWQVLLSLLLLVGSFVVAVWVGSRIYRIGILMYGKRPSVRDILRWLRYA